MDNYSCFIMGMPEAGKTTYLAALWHILTNYKENKLNFDCGYVNAKYISDMGLLWAGGRKVPRTKQDSDEEISFRLIDNMEKKIKISFPDLSGEVFQNMIEERETSGIIESYIKNTDSIMLFINPSKENKDNLIVDVPKEFRGANDSKISKSNFKTHTQVDLVELLQFIKIIRCNKKVKIMILLSAWDKVEKSFDAKGNRLIPEHYLRKRFGFFWQYIESNSKYFEVSYYGISAQGTDLPDDENKCEELEKNRKEILSMETCDRPFIIDEIGIKHKDITIPIYEGVVKK